jgi:DNA-binding beta-propeller fold protein YncE
MICNAWRTRSLWTWAVLAFASSLVAPMAFAQDEKKEDTKEEAKEEPKKEEAKEGEAKPDDAAAGPKPKVSVIHLDNPSGVAVNPATKHVFAVSKQGVFRFVPGKPGKIYLEIDGFPTDVYGKGPMYDIGPLGVAMWGTDRIVVGDGSRKDAEELVRIYKVEEAVPEKPRKEDAAEFTLGPIAAGEASAKGEGNFYGVAAWNDALYFTANGDDTKGWILKSAIADGKPGELTPAIATKELTEVDAPIAITVSPDKANLVVGQGGEVNVPGDSLLTMYDAEGKLVKKYATGLHDICGLAYSPTGKLYAVDFAWADTTQGGLFELVIEGEEVKANKVISLDRPTALAFDADGGLYITVFGLGDLYKAPAGTDPAKEDEKPKGGLIRLEPGL